MLLMVLRRIYLAISGMLSQSDASSIRAPYWCGGYVGWSLESGCGQGRGPGGATDAGSVNVARGLYPGVRMSLREAPTP
jgi:hypothetical protein